MALVVARSAVAYGDPTAVALVRDTLAAAFPDPPPPAAAAAGGVAGAENRGAGAGGDAAGRDGIETLVDWEEVGGEFTLHPIYTRFIPDFHLIYT